MSLWYQDAFSDRAQVTSKEVSISFLSTLKSLLYSFIVLISSKSYEIWIYCSSFHLNSSDSDFFTIWPRSSILSLNAFNTSLCVYRTKFAKVRNILQSTF